MMNKFFFLSLCLGIFSGCFRVSDKIEPHIDYTVEEQHISSLPTAFSPLSAEEKKEDWGKEYQIALAFANNLDLYRSISTFKRAEVLVPQDNSRKQEIQYLILYSYYLGKKYPDVIYTFENSELPHVDKTFSAFHDLLVILYDSYQKLDEHEKAEKILDVIDHFFSGTKEKVTIATDLQNGDLQKLEKVTFPPAQNYIPQMLHHYYQEKKSIPKAQTLNALLPGSGYLYLGQKKSAVTAFLINSLFIAAAYQFFHKGYIAAGAITTSFEAGWYFGGIYGAGQEAKYYNERLYQENAATVMEQEKLFPIFMLQYGF